MPSSKLTVSIVLALREEVINVTFSGNINKIRDRETKDFVEHFTGNYRNLKVNWVYKNESFVFKTNDTLYANTGFILRDGNTYWDLSEYEIQYWRQHSSGKNATTRTKPTIDYAQFEFLDFNLGKLNPAVKKFLLTTRNPFRQKS